MRRREPLGVVQVDLVVAHHLHLDSQRAEQVREVVRERVVVVDQQDHRRCSCLRELDRSFEGAELVQALLVLVRRIGVGGDAAARLEIGDAVAQDERADRDARVELTLLREHIADGAGVDAPPVTFELGDDLHRAHLRRAGDGAGREARAQQLEGRAALAQLTDDLRHEMRDVRVPLRLP